MTDQADKESARELVDPRASDVSAERASESVISPEDHAAIGRAPPPVPPSAVSGQIELGPDMYPETPAEGVSIAPPPSTAAADAMRRGQTGPPLSTIVGVGAGIVVALVALSLLLFR